MTPEELIARLIHRDASVLVLDKPAGLPVHRGPKGGETLTDHLDALRFGLKWRPELAHRLDRDTSGCLALGRHPRALRDLNELFRTGKARKLYWAVVAGGPEADDGLIDCPLARKSPERGWWMKPDPAGQPARTRFRVLGRATLPADATIGPEASCPRLPQASASSPPAPKTWLAGTSPAMTPREPLAQDGITWLELEPLTGRTHQLRVHCAAGGFPILGDSVYGEAARGADLHLHARSLELPLHPKKPPIFCEAPPPEHMREALTRCGWEKANGE